MNLKKEDYIQVSGELFTAVQSSGIFKDSKTFVDSIPKTEPELILDHYHSEKKKASFDLKKFILSNFNLPEEKEAVIDLPEKRNMKEHIKLLWQVLKREATTDKNKFSTLKRRICMKYPFIATLTNQFFIQKSFINYHNGKQLRMHGSIAYLVKTFKNIGIFCSHAIQLHHRANFV